MLSRIALFVLAASVHLSAQTVERSIDVSAFGYEAHNVRPVDADGDASTEEWLAEPRQTGGRYQVIAVGAAGVCFGAWFDPGDGLPLHTATVSRLGARDVLVVREFLLFTFGPALRVVGLTRPPCE